LKASRIVFVAGAGEPRPSGYKGTAVAVDNVEPGTHAVAAQSLGYDGQVKTVTVEVGQVVGVQFTLEAIFVGEVYHETEGPFAGFFECKMSATNGVLNTWTGNCGSVCVYTCVWSPGQLWPNDETVLQFQMTSDDYRSVVGEMRWEQVSYGTSDELRMAFSHDNRTSTHWFCSGEGPSPMAWRFERPDADTDAECLGASRGSNREPAEPSGDIGLRVYANVPFPRDGQPTFLALQQHFEMLVTVFYGEPAPEVFTGFPDA
jgi:hypothetical protein